MGNSQVEHLREIIHLLVRRLGLVQREGVQCCGTSLVQSYIIYEISRSQGLSLNELADRLGLDKSTTSRHVQTLVKDGYVVSKPGEEDRRFITLTLTGAGEELQQRLAAQMTEYIREIFELIPPNKREQVIDSMEILLAAISRSSSCCKWPL